MLSYPIIKQIYEISAFVPHNKADFEINFDFRFLKIMKIEEQKKK